MGAVHVRVGQCDDDPVVAPRCCSACGRRSRAPRRDRQSPDLRGLSAVAEATLRIFPRIGSSRMACLPVPACLAEPPVAPTMNNSLRLRGRIGAACLAALSLRELVAVLRFTPVLPVALQPPVHSVEHEAEQRLPVHMAQRGSDRNRSRTAASTNLAASRTGQPVLVRLCASRMNSESISPAPFITSSAPMSWHASAPPNRRNS